MELGQTPSQLGASVRRERHKADLTQAELAERAGVSREWVVRLEKGNRGVELGHVLRTLAALGMQLSYDVAPSHGGPPTRRPESTIDMVRRRADENAERVRFENQQHSESA